MKYLTFAFVIDGDVFHYLQIPEDPGLEGVIAGLRSGPMLVEVPDYLPERMGADWKYIDGEFVAPSGFSIEEDYEVED